MTTLIEVEPTLHQEVGKNEWMFQYGAGQVGQPCSPAYFNSQNPRYVRYNVIAPLTEGIEQNGSAVFVKVSERPLTPDELRHFSRLVKQIQRSQSPMLDRDHGRFV